MAWWGRSKPYDRTRLLAEAARARTKGKARKALALLETVLAPVLASLDEPAPREAEPSLLVKP